MSVQTCLAGGWSLQVATKEALVVSAMIKGKKEHIALSSVVVVSPPPKKKREFLL